jgi:hypothetical protein
MAGGAFINGPVFEPRVEVEQIFRLRNPLVPDSGLPTVVIGVNRQIEFQEAIGSYDGTAAVLEVTSLTTFSATLVELAAISYVDEDGVSQLSPSLPNVIFRHAQYGDSTIPKKDVAAGVLGWTFSQTTGEFTLDAGMTFDYTIATGTADVTAQIAPGTTNAGYRTLTDTAADFIAAVVGAGDIVTVAQGTFSVISVSNETTLIVEDAQGLNLTPTGSLDDVSYTITKAVDEGSVLVTYVANRSDRADELITVDDETVEAELGELSFLNPLGFFVNLALQNTNTSIIALQLASDDAAGWADAIETLEQSGVPYDLVPLTQDRTRISEIINHVNLMSTPAEAKERRAFINYPLVIQSTKAESGATFNPVARPTASTVTVTVLAGNNNLHVLGVVAGDVFRDITDNFGGEARIVSIVPASAAPDASVTLTVAVPNTLGLIGTPAVSTLTPVTAQEFTVNCDVSGTLATDVVHINVDGTTTIFTAEAVPALPTEFLLGDDDDFFATVDAFYGDRLNITQPGGAGTPTRIADSLGGATNVGLRSSASVTWTLQSGGAFVVALPAGPDTALPANDINAGHLAGDTFVLHDVQGGVIDETFTFRADQSTANGAQSGGTTTVQIGGPVMTAALVRDRIIDAINNGTGTGASTVLTATEGTSPDVVITADEAGLGDAADNVVSVTVPLTTIDAPGTGVNGGTPLTDWEVVTKALTADEQATQIAQYARDTSNRRVINVWPDQADYVFTDESAGVQLAQQGQGIFGGGDVNIPFQPNYGSTVALSALRSNVLASTPLTKRPVIGPFFLRRLKDTYTKDQLARILSTGNTLMEQPAGFGATVQAVHAVSTNSSDLKLVEENVAAQVDKFTRLVRLATTPIFGPNIIDPDGNFFELFSTKVQAVIDRMTNRRTREAKRITIIRVLENPDRADSVIMEIEFVPLFGANLGIIQIFV